MDVRLRLRRQLGLLPLPLHVRGAPHLRPRVRGDLLQGEGGRGGRGGGGGRGLDRTQTKENIDPNAEKTKLKI